MFLLTLNVLSSLGQGICRLSIYTYSFIVFAASTLYRCFNRPIYLSLILHEVILSSYFSLAVIGLTAFFTGAVLALQSYTGFSRFNAEASIPIIVVLSLTRELGPVLGSLMFSARVGSRITAEISAMNVSEQIDAMRTMSIDPKRYIILPKILACLISLPILILIADIIGVMGGYIISTSYLKFASGIYIRNTLDFLSLSDVLSGLIKAVIFGMTIGIISTFNGYTAIGGAENVGQQTTKTVASCAVAILSMNYIITAIFF